MAMRRGIGANEIGNGGNKAMRRNRQCVGISGGYPHVPLGASGETWRDIKWEEYRGEASQ